MINDLCKYFTYSKSTLVIPIWLDVLSAEGLLTSIFYINRRKINHFGSNLIRIKYIFFFNVHYIPFHRFPTLGEPLNRKRTYWFSLAHPIFFKFQIILVQHTEAVLFNITSFFTIFLTLILRHRARILVDISGKIL